MPRPPNILFLMADQMQGGVLRPNHPCKTPNFDRLAARGVRFCRAYTPNAVCSPARASLMTGLLPHNHGVLEVTHVVDEDQCCLRTQHPHWAQGLEAAGYRTGYFGKWHVERSNDLAAFGWQTDGGSDGSRYAEHAGQVRKESRGAVALSRPMRSNQVPPGYRDSVFYAATDESIATRNLGLTTGLAMDFLQKQTGGEDPWCCFVSVQEPHDPFIAGRDTLAQYDVDQLPLSPNTEDDLAGRPNLYRKAGGAWNGMTLREKREAVACYYALITEIDAEFGRLIDYVEEKGELANTIVVLTSDHGELLGAHGLYCKNIGAFEEVYQIPMIVSGPGVAAGKVSNARVGLHDLYPTLLDLAGIGPAPCADSRSFVPALKDPEANDADFDFGFAEYHGGRYRLTQRIVWKGDWKFVHNGFDFDELYHLKEDPWELTNRINDPDCAAILHRLVLCMWQTIKETGDHALLNTHYPILRLAPFGPLEI
jgi:arylsulfatase A-like enzyme